MKNISVVLLECKDFNESLGKTQQVSGAFPGMSDSFLKETPKSDPVTYLKCFFN